jgi:transcription elongation factor GreA
MNSQKKTQITEDGLAKLKAELEELKNIRRPKVVDTLQKARSMGDLSENSAYHAAREELSLVEGRLQEIEQILRSLEVVPKNEDSDSISLGSTVTVKINDQKTDIYQIVGEYEADPIQKKISSTSPLGQALMGKKVNETAKIEAPAGKILYQIINIK